jgi:uncharacterized protein (TIGR02118 family)
MIRITVSYPNHEGAHFDHAYYQNQHAAIAREQLSSRGMLRFEIDEVLADGTGGTPPVLAAAHIFFEDMQTFQTALAAANAALEADVPNFTNITPTILISRTISAL